MHIPVKRLGPIVLASLMALGAARTARAHTLASPVTVTVAFEEFGTPPYFEEIAWKKIKQQVEAANSNIKVRLLPIVAAEGDYYTKIDLMLRSANTAPDVLSEDSFLIGSDATAGYLEPLDRYLAGWPRYKSMWYPSMQSITTFKGHNYGVMNGTDVRLLWYNKNIFRKAGLPTVWQPHSWADILKAARTIKAKVPGVIPMNVYSGIPADEASSMQGLEMLLYGTKDPLYDYKTNKWVVTSKGFQDSLDFIGQVFNQSNLLGPPDDIALSPEVQDKMANQFIPDGKVGIANDGSWISSSWYPNGAHPWPQWQQVMGVAKMPTQFGQAPYYVTMSGGWSYAISAKSAHKAEAFSVIKAFCDRDALATFDVNLGNIAPHKDAVQNAAYSKVPLNAWFTSLLSVTLWRPGFPAYPKISNQIDLAMENVMSGMKSSDAMSLYADAVTGIVGANNVERR